MYSQKKKIDSSMHSSNKRRKLDHDHEHKSLSSYSVHPRRKFDGRFPMFRKPVEVGSFSLDIERVFYNDRSKLKYFFKPRNYGHVNFDLTLGYSDMIRKDENTNDLIDDILRWILKNRSCFMTEEEKFSKADCSENKCKRNLHTDFVCWRGLLTKLLCTPYENRDDWKIAITLHNHTYYMCQYDTEKRKDEKSSMTERQNEMTYWGWKFEQYVTTSEIDGKPDTYSPVNNCEAFCTVVRSRLDKHSIVYSGEVDAVDPKSSCDNKYVEFKTSREIDTSRQDENFKRFKLIKWWAQSYLVGIPLIVCGFRDDDGIVHRLENFETGKIPKLVQDIRDPWTSNICFNFLNEFFDFVKRTVKIDNPKIVYMFEWEPGRNIHCRMLEENSKYCFLPEWYIKPS